MRRTFANHDEQRAFRDELEQMLRRGEPDAALAKVRRALEPVAAAGSHLARLALTLNPRDVRLVGWEWFLSERFAGSDVTAIGIEFSWPGHFSPRTTDADGNLEPVLETNYYEDMDIVHFSTASREQILAGYSGCHSEWQGNFSDIEVNLEVKGMERLYGAIWSARRPGDSDDAAGDAYVLAACASAIVLHLAVRNAVRTRGLGKPLAVLVGSNEDFPFFDAPVMSIDEARPFVHPPMPEPPRSPQGRRNAGAFSDSDDLAAIARVAEAQLSRVRKPKDILPALGTVGLFALTQYLGKRK